MKDTCSQEHYVPVWLRSIGTQIKYVKEVFIDFSAVFSSNCIHAEHFDVLPLLCIVPKIIFVHANCAPHPELEGEDADPEGWSQEQIEVLNKTVKVFGDRDGLDLKRYSRSRARFWTLYVAFL
jgi:hypothetical protein